MNFRNPNNNFTQKNGKLLFPIRSQKLSEDRQRIKQSKANFDDEDDDEPTARFPIESNSITKQNLFSRVGSNKQKITESNQFNERALAHDHQQPQRGVYIKAEDRYKLLDDIDNGNCAGGGGECAGESLGLDRPSLTGTCMDMCPEKERYWKEINYNISIFEQDEHGEYDHRRAVKDYERCSADKKEPPPHELRPTEVLVQTMRHLINNVVDTDMSKAGSWYTFLWSRTRSLRKDISQQNLRNDAVVDIVETITRFHIFCAARLCEETTDNFDDKLNEENLKNCLVSLKDMYCDMPGGSCRNEAEFRSYMIVINLDKPEALDAAVRLPASVFNSPEVRYALRICGAIHSNNYVRFFRLMQSADFIMACLLHRFVGKMRLRALLVACKAYVVNKTSDNQLPLHYFKRLLCFNDLDKAEEFCRDLGITVLSSPDGINNHRSIVLAGLTSHAYTTRRSIQLVEKKQGDRPLSHWFNGHTLRSPTVAIDCAEPPPLRMLSFDRDGRYIGELKLPQQPMAMKESNRETVDTVTKGSLFKQDNSWGKDTITKGSLFKDASAASGSLFGSVVAKEMPIWKPDNAVKEPSSSPRKWEQSLGVEEQAPMISSLFSKKLDTSPTKRTNNLFAAQPYLTYNNSGGERQPSSVLSPSSSTSYGQNFLLPSEEQQHRVGERSSLFYLAPSEETVDEDIDECLSDSEQEGTQLTEEELEDIADDIECDLIDELSEEVCEGVVATEKVKVIETSRVYSEMLSEIVSESANESLRCALSEELLDALISEEARAICQQSEERCRRKVLYAHRINLSLTRKYFLNWRRHTDDTVRARRSLCNLRAAPRMVDDFTACEDFRGRVRKIATGSYVRWATRGAGCGEPPVKVVKTTPPPPRRSVQAQTDRSCAATLRVTVRQFVRDSVQARFLAVVDRQRAVLELAQQVDPAPDALIADYNSIVDAVTSTISDDTRIQLGASLRLPPVPLSALPPLDWRDYMCSVFSRLGISHNARVALLEEMNDTLECLHHSHSLPQLSYFHLRMFPWLKIVRCAVLNRLALLDRLQSHEVEVRRDSLPESRLGIEDTAEGLSIERCLEECEQHRQRLSARVEQTPLVAPHRRQTAFTDLLNLIAGIEQKIDQCKLEY